MDTDTLRAKLGLEPAEVPEEPLDPLALAAALGSVLKRLRTLRGMFQHDLAYALGYEDRTNYSKWENGKTGSSERGLMDTKTLGKLAAFHGLKPSELLAMAERGLDNPSKGV